MSPRTSLGWTTKTCENYENYLRIRANYLIMNIFKAAKEKFFKIFPRVTGDILLYGIGGSLFQLVGLITIPFITRIIPSDEMGIVDVVNAIATFLTILMALQLVSGLMRYFYEVNGQDSTDRKRMISSVVWFTLLFGGLLVWIVSLFSAQISQALFSSPKYATAIVLAAASLPFTALKDIFTSVLRMQRKPLAFLLLNLFYALASFLLILLFVLSLKKGINGYFTAHIIAAVFVAMLSAWMCRGFFGLTFSKKWFGIVAAYSIPMVPGGLLNWGMMSINRILLTQYTTDSQIAYYGLAIKAAKVIEMAVTAFIMGWLPVFLENINSETFHKKMDKVFRYYIYATISMSAVVTVFAREFFIILAPDEYAVGASLVALLCLKHAITGSTYTFTVGITKMKKTYLVSVSTAAGVAVTILASVLLSPRYGIFGAAIADVLGILVYTLLMLIFSNKLIKLELAYKPIVLSVLTFLGLWIVTITVKFANGWIDLLFRAGLLAIFFIVVFVLIDHRKLLITLKNALTSGSPKTVN